MTNDDDFLLGHDDLKKSWKTTSLFTGVLVLYASVSFAALGITGAPWYAYMFNTFFTLAGFGFVSLVLAMLPERGAEKYKEKHETNDDRMFSDLFRDDEEEEDYSLF